MSRVRRGAAGLVALLLVGALAGCSGEDVSFSPNPPQVDVDTPQLVKQKQQAGVEDCRPGNGDAVDGGLPDLVLPCFGGGTDVDLSSLRGPLVVNLWQGACAPCREEMPALEDFYQRYGDQVDVLGVDYLDVQTGVAMDLVEKTGVTYPLVADPGGDLGTSGEVRVVGLPHFVLVAADGTIAYQAPGGIDSVEELVDLVDEHLGVDL